MLAFVAAVFFVIAFLINATSTSTDVVFSPTSLMLVGLAFLAVQTDPLRRVLLRLSTLAPPVAEDEFDTNLASTVQRDAEVVASRAALPVGVRLPPHVVKVFLEAGTLSDGWLRPLG
ncbi:hypothetical protein ACFVYD_06685 [Streptomyces sp. NPDC058301]|uniref:hypothetical protein n=1 Tax=Streptomyces sp. NPDC058301 TaxID=3346436 RepID=UPI0036ECD2DA